ncbi:Uncharacterised protein [BD1-7 clade bacterium]|uniref:Amine oxidase domain-containing protein n=1 Tax=BD1-7 clade bacterium TaxID=2029982 RepID=A0A5S9QMW3_9GAMM|nr:Uncharacterised protein [BD1-7 clade bacterium]
MKKPALYLFAIILMQANNAFAKDKVLAPDIDVVVVGAGAAGIAAGNMLKMAGANFVVLEKADQAGGVFKLQKHERNQFSPYGPAFAEPSKFLSLMIKNLGMETKRQNNSREVLADCPAEITESKARGKSLDEISASKYFDKADIESENVLDACEQMSFHYYGAGLDDVSARALSQAQSYQPQRVVISYGKRGVEGLGRVFKESARSLGTNLRYQTNVKQIKEEGGLYKVEFKTPGDKQALTLVARAVIIATDAETANKIGKKTLNKYQRKLVGKVKYGPGVTVNVFSDKQLWILSKSTRVNNYGDVSQISADFALQEMEPSHNALDFPRANRGHVDGYVTVLRLSPRSQDNKLLNQPEDKLIIAAKALLNRIDPKITLKAKAIQTVGFAKGLPIPVRYIEEYRAAAMQAEQGVYLAGTYTTGKWVEGANAAVESGHQAALKVLDHLKKTADQYSQ